MTYVKAKHVMLESSLSQPLLREKLISTNSQVRVKVVFIGYITRFVHDNNLKSLE